MKNQLRLKNFVLASMLANGVFAGLAQAAQPVYSVRFYAPGMKASPSLRFSDANGLGGPTLSFPATTEGSSSAPQIFTAKNMSVAPVVFGATPFTVSAPYSLSSTTCTGTLAPGDTCTMTIVFSPAAYGTGTGAYLAINTTSAAVAAPTFSGKVNSLPYLDVVANGGTTNAHAFFKKSDGRWLAAGNNTFGAIGGGSYLTMPAGNPAIFGATKVVTGVYHSLALMPDGTVKGTGGNWAGQIGFTDHVDRATWTTIPGITGAKNVVASFYASYIQMADNSWMSAGQNGYGELGLGDTAVHAAFTTIPGTVGSLAFLVGAQQAFLKDSTGNWFVTGMNDRGQLGLGDLLKRMSFTAMPGVPAGATLYAGWYTTFAKDSSNNWLVTGDNSSRLYGNASASTTSLTALPGLNGLTNMTLAIDGSSAFAKLATGDWNAVGDNGTGQLGLGDKTYRTAYTLSSAMTGSSVVASSGTATFIIKGGVLYAAGSNTNNALGLPVAGDYPTFTPVTP